VTTAGRRTELLLYLGPVTLFYVVFLVLPYAMVLRLSFFRFSSMRLYVPEFTMTNYLTVVTDPFYLGLMVRTVGLGLVVTVFSLILGYPLALKIARSGPTMKSFLIAVTLSPLLINLLVRTYAWLVLLGDTGVVNNWLRAAGVITRPLPLGGNMFSVIVGLVHISLPLMALSLIGVLERIDASLVDAADSLGASRGRILRKIILPLSLPGIGAGSLLTFSFAISSFITPALLGGNRVSTISTLIYEKFTFSSNWPVGATLVVVLLVINVAVVALHGRLFREA
jgi:putative spermidine/putrescine transport system permease protein